MSKDEVLRLALDWFKCYQDKSMSRNNAEELADEVIVAIKAALEAKDDKRTQIEPWAIREEQVCPNKVCWHPYHCENGRCVEAENNVFLSKSYQKEKNCE